MKFALKRFFESSDRWSIGIYTGNSPCHFVAQGSPENPVLTAKDVTDRKAEFVSDPFMVKDLDIWYMFFEVMDAIESKGDIGLAESRDGLHWQYRQIVLSEPFHLSYPYVFQWGNDYYMVPETSSASSIRLYRAVEFPLKWSFVADLVCGNFSDPSIFRYNDQWWMFTAGDTEGSFKTDILRLYHSVDLLGPWEEHPRSPIVKNNPHIARPAGRVLVLDDRIIRYAQDDYGIYGNKVRAFEITKLSVLEYEEKEVHESPVLKAAGRGWNKDGMHTIDPHPTGEGRWIACVDGNERYPWVLHSLYKLMLNPKRIWRIFS